METHGRWRVRWRWGEPEHRQAAMKREGGWEGICRAGAEAIVRTSPESAGSSPANPDEAEESPCR